MRTEPPADERCARCGQVFQCGMSGDTPCACTSITLDEALLQRLQAQFTGCLCMSCLRALALGTAMEGTEPPAPRAS